MTPCLGGGSGVGVCTFRAESRQLVTEAFPPPRGHDQEHIPAGQRQVNRPELQRAEPLQMEGVLQMLRHLPGPWEIYETRAKQRAVRSGPLQEASTELRVDATAAIKALHLLPAGRWFTSGGL